MMRLWGKPKRKSSVLNVEIDLEQVTASVLPLSITHKSIVLLRTFFGSAAAILYLTNVLNLVR